MRVIYRFFRLHVNSIYGFYYYCTRWYTYTLWSIYKFYCYSVTLYRPNVITIKHIIIIFFLYNIYIKVFILFYFFHSIRTKLHTPVLLNFLRRWVHRLFRIPSVLLPPRDVYCFRYRVMGLKYLYKLLNEYESNDPATVQHLPIFGSFFPSTRINGFSSKDEIKYNILHVTN